MKKLILVSMILCGSISSYAFNYDSTEGRYEVKSQTACSGDDYPRRMSPEIIIQRAGVYSELKVTPKLINGKKNLVLEIRDGSPGSSEVAIPLSSKKYKVKGNKISFKSKGRSRITTCDALGFQVPCFRNEIWDHSWSLTFEKNQINFSWSSFDKAGSCKFSKR